MTRFLFFFLLLAAAALPAQTMLPAAQWCAMGKKAMLTAPPPGPADTRSDSIDIWETTIELDISDFSSQTIGGAATIKFKARVDGIREIRLDLLNMIIDSVYPSAGATWSYDKQVLRYAWTTPMNAGQNGILKVYYHGEPVQDASGWGGFYWQGDYAYNLGVGFAADPHNFGRAWFPCFDNFQERCAFKFDITTPADRPAFCNGRLMAQTPQPDGKVKRLWVLDEEIPSYLACVAVGPYTAFQREYPGENGPVPVQIAAFAADTNKLKASFVHLPDALKAFEHWYGPYQWNKIGYSVVPFNQGAMEHATNIAYMRSAVDGSTGSERLFAHELSHHWWGDLATCASAGDMWLNEGWATYSEHLFLEQVYGPEAYQTAVRNNFLDVLEDAHIKEGGYRAVSGLPHDLTYGTHVYNKGAVVAHNLRGYLGDTLFRAGLRTVLKQNSFADWSSAAFRNKLSAATGYDLTDFFDDWVFQPGFTHFSIDSVQYIYSPVDAPTQVIVYVKQKLRGAEHLFQHLPLEFTFVNFLGQREYRTAQVSGENSVLNFTFPAFAPAPVRVWVNTRQRLTLARAEKELVAKTLGNLNFAPAKMSMAITALPKDSALIRVEHHYVMPDTAGSANPKHYRLSHRYWTVDGLPGAAFAGDATVVYDGRGSFDQLDAELFAQTGPSEDSIILVHRPGPGHPWQEYPNYSKNTLGSTKDRYGFLRIRAIEAGEYAIAKGKTELVGTANPSAERIEVTLSPNPARHRVRINAAKLVETITVFNQEGEIVQSAAHAATRTLELDTSSWPAGTYWLLLEGPDGAGLAGPLAVVR